MNTFSEPMNSMVSVVTPVYNGENYLQECIESVLNQTYENFEYIIVNNCSIDRTGQIARQYSAKDNRIKVYDNPEVFPIMHNWNHALSLISPNSEYCKIVHADDWLFPRCLEEMVALAEKNNAIGIIGAYSMVNNRIQCVGLPHNRKILPGRTICKETLNGDYYLFYSPSSLMIRSDLIRNKVPFYKENILYADVDTLYTILEKCMFGFVHQVLTFIRKNENSVTSKQANPLNQISLSNLNLFLKYGPLYLDKVQYQKRHKQLISEYYRVLAINALQLKNRKFWNFHCQGLKKAGYPLSLLRVIYSIVAELLYRPVPSSRIFLKSLLNR